MIYQLRLYLNDVAYELIEEFSLFGAAKRSLTIEAMQNPPKRNEVYVVEKKYSL